MDKQKSTALVLILVSFFLIGIFTGCMVALRASEETSEYLSSYIGEFRGSLADGSAPPVGQALLNSFLFPAVIFILSFTIFGVAGIPLLLAAKAFFLSFAVASFVRALSSGGVLLALIALGPQNIIAIPCLMLLSVQGMRSSIGVLAAFSGKAKTPGGFYGKRGLIRALFCALLLAAAVLIELYIQPLMFSVFAVNI